MHDYNQRTDTDGLYKYIEYYLSIGSIHTVLQMLAILIIGQNKTTNASQLQSILIGSYMDSLIITIKH